MSLASIKAAAMSLIEQYHAKVERLVAMAPHHDDKFVHVQAGLLVWCLAALVTRRRLSSPLPLAAVFAAAMANELMDRMHAGSWRWPDTLGDLLATWLWPTILFVLLRWYDGARPPVDAASAALAAMVEVDPAQANSGTGPRPPLLHVGQLGKT